MYKALLQPLLFNLEAETAHEFTVQNLKRLYQLPGVPRLLRQWYDLQDKALERQCWGLTFPNPIGLAAGFDKNARLVQEMACFGFGFIEIGTLTPKPQPGNPRPRMFRLKEDQALINHMGFNNDGVEAAAARLRKANSQLIIGGNIGKNKDTPNEKAVEDYLLCFDALFDVVDYFVVNVSSPNTPGLRQLQDKEPLTQILNTLRKRNQLRRRSKPILLKIAPDLTVGQVDDIIDIVLSTKTDGIVATNTTLSREGLKTTAQALDNIGAGGLSGKPLTQRATDIIRYIHSESGGQFPIIGVGGIHNAQDVIEKLEAGASLVQVYTGFIYEGPGLCKEINSELLRMGPLPVPQKVFRQTKA
jgi:dihydroorotate dehydrogenase